MRREARDVIWLAAAAAFIAYPLGDVLNFWQMEPSAVLIAAPLLLFAGRDVGKTERKRG